VKIQSVYIHILFNDDRVNIEGTSKELWTNSDEKQCLIRWVNSEIRNDLAI